MPKIIIHINTVYKGFMGTKDHYRYSYSYNFVTYFYKYCNFVVYLIDFPQFR